MQDYQLTVPVSGKATLKASTIYGALRGLEASDFSLHP
jgi:hypothetical protein